MAASGYSPISLYYSTTASATPTNTNLVNGELALNITDGKLFYKDNAGTVQTLATKAATSGSFSTTTISTSETLSYGTANGVAYLNGSKVVTTGSALTFDGTNLNVGSATFPSGRIRLKQADDTTKQKGLIIEAAADDSLLAIGYDGSAFTFNPTYNTTGGYKPMAWWVSGSEAMRLTSTGLGIGTSSVTSKLVVSNAGAQGLEVQPGALTYLFTYNRGTSSYTPLDIAGDYLRFSTGNASEKMRLDSSGNLGIGTSSPGAKLGVGGNAIFSGGVGGSPFIAFSQDQTGGTPSYWQWASTTGLTTFYTTNASSANGSFRWMTAGAERMRLDSSGNLGIGTSSPVDKLEVYSIITARASSGTSALRLRNTTTDMQWQTVAGTNAINLYDNAVGSSRLTVDSSGNLGIGTSSPGYKLDVNGTARFNNTFDFGAGQSITSGSGAYRAAKFGAASGAYNVLFSGSTAFQINDNADTANLLVLTNSGNLGIGTSSPTVNLHVYNASSAEIRIASANIGLQLYSSEGAGTSVIGTYTNHALVFRTNATERARITSGGEVYIAGTTDQGAYNLQVNGTGVWGAGAYVNGSDARLKEEVQDLAPALDVIASLRPVTFRYKEDYSKDQNVQPGFIAQELQTAMAGQAYVDGVIQFGPQHLNVAYQSLIPLLTKAIQELKAEFDAYKATHP